MARYLSFHAGSEGKMTRKDVKGLAGHTFRKTEQRYKNHGNKDIDTSLTKYNSDWISGKKSSLDEIVEERLENEYKGKRALRKDAVVVREVIAQASPSVYEGLTIEEKREKAIQFTKDSLKWFRKEFGSKNVVGLSVHLDETNPHTHFAIMPMTKDGRMSQKDFFKGPSDLKRQHREFRKHMNDLGWEFEEENKYENVDGVSLPKYKANAKELEQKRKEQQEMIAELSCDPDIREEARQNVEKVIHDGVLAEARKKMDEEREKLEQQAEILKEKERQVAVRERTLKADEEVSKQRWIEAKALHSVTKKREARYKGILHAIFDGDSKFKPISESIDNLDLARVDMDILTGHIDTALVRASRGYRSRPFGDKNYMDSKAQQVSRQHDDELELG